MRVDIPDYRSGGQVESQATGDRAGGPDISLRYTDHETAVYHRDVPESEWYVALLLLLRMTSNINQRSAGYHHPPITATLHTLFHRRLLRRRLIRLLTLLLEPLMCPRQVARY